MLDLPAIEAACAVALLAREVRRLREKLYDLGHPEPDEIHSLPGERTTSLPPHADCPAVVVSPSK